ncbi:MAG: hypothetical protein CMH57_05940 [Myxococcales bacterium]|nr:hypothetical protein [Myxococcales bacterium]
MTNAKRPSASGYVLKFISGKYQGGEFPINLGQEVLIGRSSELDMVLVEDMVSRQHSRIVTENGQLYIEDLGSTNGTFVNGEKIFSRKLLKEGDRILVGTNIIKLVTSSADGSISSSQRPRVFNPDFDLDTRPPSGDGRTNDTSTHPIPNRRPATKMQGFIDEVPLPDLLQLFSTSKKDGVLVVRSERTGRIFLRGGRVYYTAIDERPDVPAHKSFYRMLAWETGTFVLEEPSSERFEDEIEASTEAMMMEGMRQLDEIRNLGDNIPPFEANLYIEQPLIPPLRALTPELLDTLQLIHNYVEVEAILNRSLASDLETLQDIIYLMRNEYVRIINSSDRF